MTPELSEYGENFMHDELQRRTAMKDETTERPGPYHIGRHHMADGLVTECPQCNPQTMPKPGDLVPVMVEVISIHGGHIYFRSDDGTIAYRRVGDMVRSSEIVDNGLVLDMVSALEQAIMRMEDVERQKGDAAMAKVWLPACEAALLHAKVALEAWRNRVKA